MRWLPLLCALLALALTPLHAADATERRGLWVGGGTFNTPEAVADAVDRAAAAHLNALYPLVWYNGGQAWYRSKLCPLADKVDPGFDPLGHMIALAHARGLQVHAWFVNGSYGWSSKGVFEQHPDWAMQTGRPAKPGWYDLGRPEVRRFETDVTIECLRNYDLDGLHFDYIRYGGQEYCYCAHCQEEFAQRSGLPPLAGGGKLFPVALSSGGNPLGKPSTAQVLATFDDGVPAITLNKLGQGEAALLNWQASRPANPAVDDTVRRLLQRFGATAQSFCQLRTTQTNAKYRAETQAEGLEWLGALGFKARALDETKVSDVPAGGTVLLYAQYYLSEETAAWLKEFVAAGGHALFVDGPVFAIKLPDLQAVLGLTGTAPYFHGLRVISPTPGQDFLQVGPPVDAAVEKERLAKWVEYRKWTVSELVRSVYREAKQIKPKAEVSAAVFYNRQSADAVCQDWYGWLKEGIIDYVIPMAYLMDNAKLREALEEWRAADPQMARIIPGLSIYMREGGNTSSRPRELVLSQVELSRSLGARGNVFFASNYLNADLTAALSGGPYATVVQPYTPGTQ
ncbi:family 10 glycosylhydrolase [bacterium]|nr:family 10 glycosylhydrolase [bacterium]